MTVMTATRATTLPSGEAIPVLGQGTWHMAEDPWRRREEIAALRLGIDLGLTLIDTAEAYADGGAERLVGEAIKGGAMRCSWSARCCLKMPSGAAPRPPATAASNGWVGAR